jgi:hypothetical protein
VDTTYVHLVNYLAPGSRDMFDANNKAVDYLFRDLCQSEFDRVHTENLTCRIWTLLKEAHVENAQVQATMYATYRREYKNFTHLLGESIDALLRTMCGSSTSVWLLPGVMVINNVVWTDS